MPIAGSSTAWSQNNDGDLALSISLVFASTILSPLTTPLVLRGVGLMTTGDQARDLHDLALRGAGLFLAMWVAMPATCGVLVRRVLGGARAKSMSEPLKLVNVGVLLLLCYSNASASLPR